MIRFNKCLQFKSKSLLLNFKGSPLLLSPFQHETAGSKVSDNINIQNIVGFAKEYYKKEVKSTKRRQSANSIGAVNTLSNSTVFNDNSDIVRNIGQIYDGIKLNRTFRFEQAYLLLTGASDDKNSKKCMSDLNKNFIITSEENTTAYTFNVFQDTNKYEISKRIMCIPSHMLRYHSMCALPGVPVNFYSEIDLSYDTLDKILHAVNTQIANKSKAYDLLAEFILSCVVDLARNQLLLLHMPVKHLLVLQSSGSLNKKSFHIHIDSDNIAFVDYTIVNAIVQQINQYAYKIIEHLFVNQGLCTLLKENSSIDSEVLKETLTLPDILKQAHRPTITNELRDIAMQNALVADTIPTTLGDAITRHKLLLEELANTFNGTKPAIENLDDMVELTYFKANDTAIYRKCGQIRLAYCHKYAQPSNILRPYTPAINSGLLASLCAKTHALPAPHIMAISNPLASDISAKRAPNCFIIRARTTKEGKDYDNKGFAYPSKLKNVYKPRRFREAIAQIRGYPVHYCANYSTWVNVGLSLFSFTQEDTGVTTTSDCTHLKELDEENVNYAQEALNAWMDFSRRCREKYSPAVIRKYWNIHFTGGRDGNRLELNWRRGYYYLTSTIHKYGKQ